MKTITCNQSTSRMNTHIVRLLLSSVVLFSSTYSIAEDLDQNDSDFICIELQSAVYNYAVLQCEDVMTRYVSLLHLMS